VGRVHAAGPVRTQRLAPSRPPVRPPEDRCRHGPLHGVPRTDLPRLLFVCRGGSRGTVQALNDALLLVDVINDFRHEDGEKLLASFRERLDALTTVVAGAHEGGIPVVYANDNRGAWDGDKVRLVREALEGPGGDVVEAIAPREGDRFVVKPRYSAFDHTPLELILRELEVDRILIAGAATEGCVVQSAIDARELGFKITVLADACASPDERLEQVALTYLEDVVGARIERVT
jgi:nicotinamidase-related amidase